MEVIYLNEWPAYLPYRDLLESREDLFVKVNILQPFIPIQTLIPGKDRRVSQKIETHRRVPQIRGMQKEGENSAEWMLEDIGQGSRIKYIVF